MADNTIKVRTKTDGGVTTVRALIKHPMETGQRKDKKTGEKIPAHYITEVTATLNGKTVMTANWAQGVSKNPYLSFKFSGGKAGDTLKISWVDNKGGGDSTETAVK